MKIYLLQEIDKFRLVESGTIVKRLISRLILLILSKFFFFPFSRAGETLAVRRIPE